MTQGVQHGGLGPDESSSDYTFSPSSQSQYLRPLQEEELFALQERLEDAALVEGTENFERQLKQARTKGAGSTVGSTRAILQRMAGSLAEAIEAWLSEQDGKRGRPNIAAKWLRKVQPEKAAYLTLKLVFDELTGPSDGAWRGRVDKITVDLATTIADEMRYEEFKRQMPRLYEYRAEIAGRARTQHHRRWSMNQAIEWARSLPDNPLDLSNLEEIEAMQQSEETKKHVGTKLLDLLLQVTDAFEVVRNTSLAGVSTKKGKAYKSYQTQVYISLRATWIDKIDAADEALADLTAANKPMVVEPLPWAQKEKGGYRFKLGGKYDLVRKVHPEWVQKVQASMQPVVFDAINALQTTRWQINHDVYGLLKAIKARGGELVGVPRYEPHDEPLRPVGCETDPVLMQKYIASRREWHEQENRRPYAIADFERLFRLAEQLVEREAIYFPWSLDFRGRVYPLVKRIDPQGDDLSRGLLRFAEGKVVDPAGRRALALHGMNCLGDLPEEWKGQTKVSKLPLDERVAWVVDHTAMLLQVAQDPFADLWWTNADKPLQFFAFCCEYTRMVEQGDNFVSHLPCSIDGSCNGLQHLAALTRDVETGLAVNMVPEESPNDLYDEIAADVRDRLTHFEPRDGCRRCRVKGFEEEVSRWASEADSWITRKLAKRPTMTFGYGSKQYGFTKQLLSFIKEQTWARAFREKFTQIDDDGKKKNHTRRAAEVLAHILWESLEIRVPLAFRVMEWLQACAAIVARESDEPVVWRVPITGFLAGQVSRSYYHSLTKQVRTTLNGTAYVPKVRTLTSKVKVTKQTNGIAPNVIHSLDAAALMLTVVEAKNHGVTAFSMIHDSYGTHAADVPLLNVVTRECFIRLHSEDVLGNLAWQFADQVDDPALLPPPPARGALDLSGLHAAPYFFA